MRFLTGTIATSLFQADKDKGKEELCRIFSRLRERNKAKEMKSMDLKCLMQKKVSRQSLLDTNKQGTIFCLSEKVNHFHLNESI